MKKIFALMIFAAIFFAATANAEGIQSGGRGATEISAVEDMKISAVKRALAHLTERSDDPNSPYQKILAGYKNFVGTVKISKRGKNSRGVFVTGTVEIKYTELRAAFAQLIKISRGEDFAREVYVFVRVAANSSEADLRAAEEIILQRYMARLTENNFVVADADEVIGELSLTRAMTFEQFVKFVEKKSVDNPAICTAIIGEIRPAEIFADADGFSASCEISIRAVDCLRGFAIIDNYAGSEVLRMKNSERVENFLCEKAAVTSSKFVTDSLVRYWSALN